MKISVPVNKWISQFVSNCLGLILIGSEFPRFYFVFSVNVFHILASTDTRAHTYHEAQVFAFTTQNLIKNILIYFCVTTDFGRNLQSYWESKWASLYKTPKFTDVQLNLHVKVNLLFFFFSETNRIRRRKGLLSNSLWNDRHRT